MKILIADDFPLTLQGTASFVESFGYDVNFLCPNGLSAYNQIKLHNPDIAILDINMPGMDGIDIAQKVQENNLRTKIILLTMHNEKTLYNKALEHNIYGYVLKEQALTELKDCIEEVIMGKHYVSKSLDKNLINDQNDVHPNLANLTFSERKIIELIAQQKTTKQIAELLFLSEKTIEAHRTNIIEKLGLPKEKNTLLKWVISNFPMQ